MTKEQAIQVLNEIYQVAFQAAVPGNVHARCQQLNKELTTWINSQNTESDPEPESSADRAVNSTEDDEDS